MDVTATVRYRISIAPEIIEVSPGVATLGLTNGLSEVKGFIWEDSNGRNLPTLVNSRSKLLRYLEDGTFARPLNYHRYVNWMTFSLAIWWTPAFAGDPLTGTTVEAKATATAAQLQMLKSALRAIDQCRAWWPAVLARSTTNVASNRCACRADMTTEVLA